MTMQFNEPWHECDEGKCGCGQILGPDSTYITSVVKPDVRRRIVACVNACRGLPTDELELNGLVSAVGNQLLDVEQRCDELLEALKEAVETIEWMHGCSSPARGEIEQAIREGNTAIAKAKGGDA